MRQLTLALLLGATSATLTDNFACNLDNKGAGSDAVKVSWTLEYDGTSVGSSNCESSLKTNHELRKDAAKTFCGTWVADRECKLYSVTTTTLTGAGKKAVIEIPSDNKFSPKTQSCIFEGTDNTPKVPTADAVDATGLKLRNGIAKSTSDKITWAAEVVGQRVKAGDYQIRTPLECQTWCTAQAKAETDMAKKVGLCEFKYLKSLDPTKCLWHTTELEVGAVYPYEAKENDGGAMYYAAVYINNDTPESYWPKPKEEENTDVKKETKGATSLVATGVAGLAAAAMMY